MQHSSGVYVPVCIYIRNNAFLVIFCKIYIVSCISVYKSNIYLLDRKVRNHSINLFLRKVLTIGTELRFTLEIDCVYHLIINLYLLKLLLYTLMLLL